MKPIDVAAHDEDWTGCALAFVAALDALPPEKAYAIARELVAELEQTVTPRQGRWMQFLERAADSLATAGTLKAPDRLIALASAVTDTIAAVAMSSRHRTLVVTLPNDPPGGVAVLGFATQASVSGRTDGRAEKREAWCRVHQRLTETPELYGRTGSGFYRPGPSNDFAVRAAEAGII